MGKLPELRKEAKERFEYVLRMDSSAVDAYLGLGELYEASGEATWARRMYRKALSLDPQNKMAREKLHGKSLGAVIGNLLKGR
jgi:Flp pilus assembly protein TadD